MTRFKMQNLVNGTVFQNLAQFKNILEKSSDLLEIWPQIWMAQVTFFFKKKKKKKWYLTVWVYFRIPRGHVPTKIELEYPRECKRK